MAKAGYPPDVLEYCFLFTSNNIVKYAHQTIFQTDKGENNNCFNNSNFNFNIPSVLSTLVSSL